MNNRGIVQLTTDIFNNMGNKTITEEEVYSIVIDNITVEGRNAKEIRSIRNIADASLFIRDSAKSGVAVDKDFILKLHGILMEGIVKEGCVYRRKNEKGFACGVYDCRRIEAELDHFFKRYNIHSKEFKPKYLAAFAHLEMIRIRPFHDGNGRVATMLMNYILMKNGLNPISIRESVKDDYFCFTEVYTYGRVIQPMVDIIHTELVRGGFDLNDLC